MSEEVRVLVVDDAADAAALMAEALELDGFRAATAADGEEALAVVADFMPHVVLLDVDMPGMDGAELTRQLRARYGDEIILIAITGRAGDDERVASTFDKVDHYFRKPVDLAALRRVLSVG